jgi:hypothetical protein
MWDDDEETLSKHFLVDSSLALSIGSFRRSSINGSSERSPQARNAEEFKKRQWSNEKKN